jgi:hypothetical protein
MMALHIGRRVKIIEGNEELLEYANQEGAITKIVTKGPEAGLILLKMDTGDEISVIADEIDEV